MLIKTYLNRLLKSCKIGSKFSEFDESLLPKQ